MADGLVAPSPSDGVTVTPLDPRRASALAGVASEVALEVLGSGEIAWVSASARDVLGWDPERLVGRSIHELVEQSPASGPEVRFPAPVEVPASIDELEIRCADGSRRWMTARAASLDGAPGELHAHLVALRDVHDQVVALEQLARSEERYRRLTDVASDVVIELGPDHRVRWVSSSVYDLFGWRPDQLVGRPIFDFLGPEAVQNARAARGEPITATVTTVTGRVRRPDGTLRWTRARRQALLAADGTLLGWLVALRDVDGQVAAELALARSEERYRLLAENATDVVALCDATHRIVWVSPTVSRVLGWTPHELEGSDPAELVHPDDRPSCGLHQAPEPRIEATPIGFLARFRLRAGAYRWMSVHLSAAGNDEVGGVIWGLRDVEDLVVARESRRQSEARLRATIDSLLDPHVLLEAVRSETGRVVDFVCLDANQAAATFVGVTPEAARGLRLAERFPEAVEAGWISIFADALARGAPLIADDLAYESTGPQANRRFDIRGAVVGDGISFTWREVTARHEAAVALAASEARYRDLVENTGDVMLRATLDSVIEWVSPSALEMTGRRVEDLVGRGVGDLVVVEDRLVVASAVAQAVLGDRSKCEARLLRRDGELKWASIIFGPVYAGDEVASFIARIRDIQAETSALEALRRSEGQLRLALRSAPVGMAVVDLDRRFVQVNPALCHLLGHDESWFVARRLSDVLDHEDDALDLRMRAQILSERDEVASWEHRVTRGDGSRTWVSQSVALLRDDANVPVSYVSTFYNVTEERDFRERLRFESTHDVLTQVSNRRDFFASAARAMARQPRTGVRVAVLFIDVDRLKETNDRFGHAAGDRLLAEIARRISAQLRAADLVARLGGDEFAVVLTELHAVADAELVAEKILGSLEEPIDACGQQIDASVSIGIALAEVGDDAETVVRHADVALYAAKRAGRARFSTYLAGGD